MKHILLTSLSQVGSGHARAAKAVLAYGEKHFPEFRFSYLDLMDYMRPTMKHSIIQTYDILAKHAPEMWGYFYEKMNTPNRGATFNKLTKEIKKFQSLKYFDAVAELNPDHIIATHSLCAELLCHAPEDAAIHAPWSTIITDYEVHELWKVDNTAHYFVSTDHMKGVLMKSGVSENAVVKSGIPVDPVFYENVDQAALKKKHGLAQNLPVILVLSGGQGFSKTDAYVEALFEKKESASIVAVAGSNTKLEERLKTLTPPEHVAFLPVGWTDVMHEFMAMADVVVTKPGGMTTTECITLNKPMIVIDPIPGQETANASHIERIGLGKIVHEPTELLAAINTIEAAPERTAPTPAAEIILSTIQKNT